MIIPSRFLLCLLCFSFLQSSRLAASTPGGEEILESLIEKASSFFEEGAVDENIVLLPLTIQAAPQATEAFTIRTSPMNTQFITDPTSAFTETHETDMSVEVPVVSLDHVPIVQVPPAGKMISSLPVGKNLGDRIMELPADLFAGFLRSPKAKQEAYKAEHEQAVQKLQIQYPPETSPELAQKIANWKQAVEGWCNCSGSEAQDSGYKKVEELASEMPQELYRLVALSQAMKILEDATAYSHYLPLVLEKYNKDAEIEGTEEAKVAASRSNAILLGRLDNVNNNIKKLEEVADAIVRLSKQKKCCLMARTADSQAAIATLFEEALEKAQQAIDCYLQYGQKMKEGDAPAAFLLRLQGRVLEYDSLNSEYRARALQAIVEGDYNQNFSRAAESAANASRALEKVSEYKNLGDVEALQVLEQGVQYHLQAVQAFVNGNSSQAGNFSKAAKSALQASAAFNTVFNERKSCDSRDVENLEAFQEIAQYHLRRAKIYILEGKEKGDAFSFNVYKDLFKNHSL
ncbi:MAG: hypothetical protein A3F67_02800 [Verrucomicrobia bacterium RIFCSPHIGHO2_12_FULL_41_10]|nr:MAG: hypothetical protein A3F67_02800 [Verrucomicrobia bacterium RIFCSPHIGHO2_12_FULL_41_10]HLB34657.1 hypothetical protein [Chthoniobacterales bacterium]